MNDKLKHIVIDIAVVFLIPIALFYLYMTLGSPAELLFGATTQPGSELVGEGQKFLSKLNELKGLTLNTDVFGSAVYKSLVDTSVPPPTEEKGRAHPFIPPANPVPPPASSPSKTKTTTAAKNLNTLVGAH